MSQQITFDIPYISLRFRAEIVRDVRMPETKTAALRGGMGEMLLRQNCVMDRDCGGCRFKEACIVNHTFYSAMKIKPPYVTGAESVGYLIECMDDRSGFKKGDQFEFTLTLFGESLAFFNIYLQAFCQLGMSGLGKEKAQFRIREVRNMYGRPVVYGSEVDMRQYCIDTVESYVRQRKEELLGSPGAWRMTFLTPLSMKYQQEFMEQFDGDALVRAAARRVQMLDYYIGVEAETPVFSSCPRAIAQTVRKEQVRRYSGTQDSHMRLKGITGTMTFDSMPEECLEYLIAGELTHVGRNTSFGFGKYRLSRDR